MNLVCSQCLGVNRVPSERLQDGPRCGKCQHPLLAGDVVDANASLFKQLIGRSELPVVVDFWAPWCGPCKMMAPVFAKLASNLKGKAIFVKVNTESEQSLAAQFAIRSIPSLKVFKQGKMVGDMAGALPESQLKVWIERHL
ncbi:MAG: thioredoxin TrxC [Bermanella sp.]